MRSENQLIIRGSGPQLARLLETLDQTLVDGWRRDNEAESRLRGLGLPSRSTRCFACTAEGRRPAAALWLGPHGANELYVTDIVFLGKRERSDDDCNLVLADFDAQVLQPARNGLAIETAMIRNRVTPATYLSSEAFRRLTSFSAAANKSSLQPTDCQRWRQFILQSHVEGATLDMQLLDEWLNESGWPEEQRHHLISEYETVRSVLAGYDEERLQKCLP